MVMMKIEPFQIIIEKKDVQASNQKDELEYIR